MSLPTDAGAAATVITGVTSGLGRALFFQAAAQGGPVIAVSRPGERSRAVLDEVRTAEGNETLTLVEADLACLQQVRTAAREVDEQAGAAGVGRLILNAATVSARAEWTNEGFEKMLAVNHLGAALMALTLEHALKRADGAGQVCVVSSEAHRWVKGVSLAELFERESARRLPPLKTYGATKLVGLVFFNELARRWPEVRISAHHPGFVSTNLGLRGSWALRLWWRLSRWRMRDAGEAAAELLAAVAKEWPPGNGGGLRYWEMSEPHALPPACAIAELSDEVWRLSCAPEEFLRELNAVRG